MSDPAEPVTVEPVAAEPEPAPAPEPAAEPAPPAHPALLHIIDALESVVYGMSAMANTPMGGGLLQLAQTVQRKLDAAKQALSNGG